MTRQGYEAAEIMREITQTGPTGIPSYRLLGEASAAFLQGDAAMYIDTLKIAAMSRNPKLSKIDGNVGYALHPVGSAAAVRKPAASPWVFPPTLKNQEAAFLFIQYMTSKAGRPSSMVELGGDPIRISTLQDPEFVEDRSAEYPVD